MEHPADNFDFARLERIEGIGQCLLTIDLDEDQDDETVCLVVRIPDRHGLKIEARITKPTWTDDEAGWAAAYDEFLSVNMAPIALSLAVVADKVVDDVDADGIEVRVQ